MAQIPVCKSVGTDLEPDDDGMHFRNRADERMMYEIIHRKACDEKGKSGIHAVSPSNGKPGGSEVFRGLCAVQNILGMPLGTPKNAFGLVCGGKLNDIGDEEVTRDEHVENKTEKYVLPTIIVAAYTNENTVLEISSGSHPSKHQREFLTLMKFSMTSRRFITTLRALD